MRNEGRFVRALKRRYKTAKNKVLGFDCSSNTVGWGLISANKDPALLAYGHIKPLNSKHDLLVRLDDLFERITMLCETLEPDHVVIEDILLFMKNRSQARTITTLAVFNRVAALAAYKATNKNIVFLPVQSIRKLVKSSLLEYDGKVDKDSLPDIIKGYLENSFEEIINRNGNVAKETFDEADGIAAAWAHAVHLKSEK